MGTLSAEHLRTAARLAAVAGACLALANCASSTKFSSRLDPKYGVSSSPRVVAFGQPVPKGGGAFRVGKPYMVAGRMYVPEDNQNYHAEGLASWYGDDFHGRLTANGEVFDMTSLTAAHPTLPMPSYVRVTNLKNQKSLIVRVNDRGPYHGNRVIDVSHRAAKLLEFDGAGIARVKVEYVGRAPLEGSDDRQLVATLRTGQPAPPPSLVQIASARPFVPESAAPLRAAPGEIPMPSERPFTLGNTSEDMASINATSEMSSSRRHTSEGRPLDNPRRVSYETDSERRPETPRIAATRPVSAYAPVYRQGAIDPMSGRGLY
jgi:rare lipoprotein A